MPSGTSADTVENHELKIKYDIAFHLNIKLLGSVDAGYRVR